MNFYFDIKSRNCERKNKEDKSLCIEFGKVKVKVPYYRFVMDFLVFVFFSDRRYFTT